MTEGFRPGVTERLGIGPGECLARNPKLVYGRMTGFGQDGPMSQAVGHDLNYVAQSGVLSMIGRAGQPPTPPLSLVGDFGGGGMLLALGILAALQERSRSGEGQVIDASMVEGAALLATPVFGFTQTGARNTERGTNIVDSGAPFYDVYETADPQVALRRRHGAPLLPGSRCAPRTARRPARPDEWCAAAIGLNPCVAPVLEPGEAPSHEHSVARKAFVEVAGIVQPAPAPKFSRTPAAIDRPPPRPGEHTRTALAEWGIDEAAIDAWLQTGAVAEGSGEG